MPPRIQGASRVTRRPARVSSRLDGEGRFAASVGSQGALALPARAFTVFDVPPGALDVTVKAENTSTLRLEAVAGRAHYVRAVPTMGWSRPSVKAVELSGAVGPRVIAPLRLARPPAPPER